MKQPMDRSRKVKNRVLGTAASAFTAASLAVGALFGAPAEIMQVDNDDDDAEASAAVVQVGKRLEKSAGERNRPGVGDRLRAFFLGQSAVVRGAVLLPLWCVGRAGIAGLALLLRALAPVWQMVLGVLLNALLLFGLFALVYKAVFPNRSLKSLFKKRNLIALTVCTLALSATDAVLHAFVPEYGPISVGIRIGVGLLALTLLSLRIFGRRQPAKAAPANA